MSQDSINDRVDSTAGEEAGDELLELCERRATVYGILSRAFRVELDQAALDALRAMRFPAHSGSEKVDRGVRQVVHALSNLWENSLTDFAVDYARTFIGGGIDAYSAAYPYESVYTSPKRLLMQEARDEVLAIYRSEGLDKGDDWREAEDHVALEHEFMQTMATRCADALRKGDDAEAARLLKVQRNFLECHLANWVPMLTADMRRFARTDLYQGLAWYVEGFLETDAQLLASVAAENEDFFG